MIQSFLLLVASATANSAPPLLTGIGNYHKPVATKSALAQKYFDQGLALFYAFHKQTSTKYFVEAERQDPTCAMAYWGEALSYAPDINFPTVDDSTSKKAIAALEKAATLAHPGEEQDLIQAMIGRYQTPAPQDRSALDAGYREKMRALYAKYPNDPDVASLYAESILILSPWNQWKADGTPQPGTLEAIDVIHHAIDLSPNHLMANHLLIHTLEGGPRAAEALSSADKLCRLTPALGHLVHMPSHIYVRTGRWAQGIQQNRLAVISDRKFIEKHGLPETYLPYMVHNRMMLAYAGMMNGDYAATQWAFSDYHELVPAAALQQMAFAFDWTQGAPFDVEKRFGHWEKLLAMPEPAKPLFVTRAIRHADRSVALAVLGRSADAEAEFQAFLAARKEVPANYVFGNNTTGMVLDVYERLTSGELLIQNGKLEEGIARLREAVAAEDQLGYDEPPDWLQPCRHTLGAALLKAGKPAEAKEVYLEDLRRIPENGWSLLGLSQAEAALGNSTMSKAWQSRYRAIWAKNAEAQASSCACLKR